MADENPMPHGKSESEEKPPLTFITIPDHCRCGDYVRLKPFDDGPTLIAVIRSTGTNRGLWAFDILNEDGDEQEVYITCPYDRIISKVRREWVDVTEPRDGDDAGDDPEECDGVHHTLDCACGPVVES